MPPQIDADRPYLSIVHTLLLPDVIFELIAHLDFLSLVRCRRVCRTWASIISRSREARQTLFLEADDGPFHTFRAAEEHDIVSKAPVAFERPAQRIPRRQEFRVLFNPWIFTHDSEPFTIAADHEVVMWAPWRRPATVWRFTDRVSSGRLDFCFTPTELVRLVDAVHCSWNQMFFTQPPVRRVLVVVQGGYMAEETLCIETEEGVRIGDLVSFMRRTKAVKVMREREGDSDFTTLNLKFVDHSEGAEFMPLQQLVEDRFGNVDITSV